MKYDPHDYQKYAVGFIKDHPVAAVLLDMGMGKSSITLTAVNDLMFDSFDIRKVLVVAPLRVAKNTSSQDILARFLSPFIQKSPQDFSKRRQPVFSLLLRSR